MSSFKENYRSLFYQVEPGEKLMADTIARKRVSPRRKKQQVRRLVFIPAIALASMLVVFAMLVNLSPAVSSAFQQIPILSNLASAVYLSQSMHTAAENDYIQHIGLEQTVGDVTMRIVYVILDQKQLNIFYTLSSERYSDLHSNSYELYNAGGAAIEYSSWSRTKPVALVSSIPSDGLRQIIFNFDEGTMFMNTIIFRCGVIDLYESYFDDGQNVLPDAPRAISAFTFELKIDQDLIREGESMFIDRSFEIDGQSLNIELMEIQPTHIRINIAEDEANTAWLISLSCYLADENGNRFNLTGYNLGAHGRAMIGTTAYHFESTYFIGSENLTLIITGAKWLDKNAQLVMVDLTNETTQNLPQGVELNHIREICYCGDEQNAALAELCHSIPGAQSWSIVFNAPLQEFDFFDPLHEEWARQLYPLFEDGVVYDSHGNEYGMLSWNVLREQNSLYAIPVGYFSCTVQIDPYLHDAIYLQPAFTSITVQDSPVEITIS